MTFGQTRLFITLHFIATLALIIFLSLITGCIEPPDDTDTGPRQPTDLTEISNVLLDASSRPDTLKSGDFVWVGVFSKTFTNPFDIQAQYTYEVTSSKNGTGSIGETNVNFTDYHVKHGIYDLKGNLVQMAENDCTLVKSPVPEFSPDIGWWGEQCKLGDYSGLPPYQDMFWIMHMPYGTSERFKFYNLTVTPKTRSLPIQMVNQNKCYNFANCEVHGQQIEFEIDDHASEAPSNYRRFSIFVTKELPYLVSNLSSCIKYQVKINQSTVNVENCNEVLDFDLKN